MFLIVTRFPLPLGIIKFFPACLDMVKKNCFVKIFSNFSKKKISMEIKFQQKALFIETCISKLSNYFYKETFFTEIYSSSKFIV